MTGEGRGGDDDNQITPLLQSTVASSSDEPIPPDPPLKKRTGNLANLHLAHLFEKATGLGKLCGNRVCTLGMFLYVPGILLSIAILMNFQSLCCFCFHSRTRIM